MLNSRPTWGLMALHVLFGGLSVDVFENFHTEIIVRDFDKFVAMSGIVARVFATNNCDNRAISGDKAAIEGAS